MNISKISNAQFQGKLKLNGSAQITRKDFTHTTYPVYNFERHKTLIEEVLLPDSKCIRPDSDTLNPPKNGIFKGNYVVDTNTIKEIDGEKMTIKFPYAENYTIYIYHNPNNSKADYDHILAAYKAACASDNIEIQA